MPFNMFVSSQPQYIGVASPPAPKKSSFFGAVSSLLGASGQTPAYKTPKSKLTATAAPSGAEGTLQGDALIAPLKATISISPTGQLVLTIVIDDPTNMEPQAPVGTEP